MIVAAIISGTVCLVSAWSIWLEERYGDQVSPDATIPAGVALIAGWLLIITLAIVAVAVAAA